MKERNDVANEYDEVIHQAAASRKYRRAFLVTLLTTIVLAIGIAALWWQLHTSRSSRIEGATLPATVETGQTVQPAMQAMAAEQPATPPQTETALAPLQLSPQRMQSIG